MSRRVEWVERTIEVAGARGRYFECGPADGRAVVIVPSMLVIAPSYDTTAAALAKRGFRVFVVELPGSGGSQKLPRAWGFERYADWIAQWLDAVGLDSSVTLVGHSNSGAAIIVAAGRHPGRVGRLVLADTIGFDESRSLMRVLAMRALDAAIEWKLSLTKGHHPFINLFTHPRNLLHQVWISATEDLSTYATKAAAPALLAWGRWDHTMPLRCAERARGLLPNARIHLSPGGSHDWIVDHPAEFADAVASFLEQTAAPAITGC